MKQKEAWANAWIDLRKFGVISTKDAWLGGFEFAKRVCSCCENPQACWDLGEEEIGQRFHDSKINGLHSEK